MDKYLTASEANKIAKENSVDGILKNILEEVEKRSQKGKFTLITREYGFGDSSYAKKKVSGVHQKVMSNLDKLGYKVHLVTRHDKVKEGQRQLLDVYLEIEW